MGRDGCRVRGMRFALPLLLLLACEDPARDDGPDVFDLGSGATDSSPDAPAPDAAPPADARVPSDSAEPDAAPPPALHVRFDPAGEGFYDTPWPSDARLTAAGTPDLASFGAQGAAFQNIVAELERSVVGFATMPIAYFAFEEPLERVALPTPIASVAALSPVQLVELAGCARVPVEVAVRAADQRYVGANTLQVKNTVGTVLEPGVPHAVVVLRSFGETTGRPTERPSAFSDALAGDGTRLAASLQPLKDCFADTDSIAVATVFTPQDPVAVLQKMRDLVADPERTETRPPLEVSRDAAWSRRRLRTTTYSGLVEMPVFQTGEPPYNTEGGALVFDDDGEPVVQRWEPVPFAVALRELDDPPSPRPALVFIDGTGWEPWRHLRSNWMAATLDAGFVVFSFMPQFHGGRAGVEVDPDLPTFNLFNPAAGRTNFREQAAETAFFLRLVREQLAGVDGLPAVDTARVAYGGHSQGALAGALTAAVEPGYAAYVLNGLSSYLTYTILTRKDLLDFELAVRTVLQSDVPLDLFNPALQLMQLGSEAVDPHNFARLWRGTAAHPGGNHVFVINGFHDDTTTPRGMDHLTLSAALPTFDPPGWDIDPLGVGRPPVVHPPVAGNARSLEGEPLTLATYLDPDADHFTIYRSSVLREMTLGFWRSALAGEVPTLAASRELMCADGADGDGDGGIDCDDDDCQGREPCVERACGDGRDGDGDGATDCDDEDCRETGACQEPDCGNGLDEDDDGLTDCDDPGCAGREPCVETGCRDREDGDGDGLVDCDDPDCAGSGDCHERRCDDGEDDDRDGLVDCADDECLRSLLCPEPACDDGTDEDGNGLADCADPRCLGTDACPPPADTVCEEGAPCGPDACADGDLGSAVGVAVWGGDLAARPDGWPPGDCTPLGSGKDSPDVALRWTAPATGTWVVSTLGSEKDTTLTVLPPDCDPLVELACNDDAGSPAAALELEMEAEQAVVIVLSAYDDEEVGRAVLHIYPRPGE